jgi:flagellar P-ring protein precursor FlgI
LPGRPSLAKRNREVGALAATLIFAAVVLALLACRAPAAYAQPAGAQAMLLPQLMPPSPRLLPPGGAMLGYRRGNGSGLVSLTTLVHVHGLRVNHLVGMGMVAGLQNTGDTQETMFSIQLLINLLAHAGVTLPSALNPLDIQTRNLAAVMVTADLPPFARRGSRIDALVSSMGDARSLQGGTLIMTPLRGADGKIYALAEGPITIEGYFAGAMGGAAARKNFQTAGQIPNGVTVEREVASSFSNLRQLQLDLDQPNATLVMRVAQEIGTQLTSARVRVDDPGTLTVDLPPWMTPVAFAAKLHTMAVETVESDRVVVDERTGTVVIGGEVTVGKAAITHGNLTITIQPQLTVSQPGALSAGTTVAMKTGRIRAKQHRGQFFMTPEAASVEQIADTLNAVGTEPGDVIAIFEGLRAAGALHGQLIIR